jgi:DNA-binding transcriptional LysR family regulator
MLFVTSLDHRLAGRPSVDLGMAAGEPFAETPPTWGVRISIDRAFRAAGIHRRVAFEVADIETVLDFVRYGLAVAIVPPSVLDSASAVCAMPVGVGAPVLARSLATAAQREISAPTRALLSTACRLARDDAS